MVQFLVLGILLIGGWSFGDTNQTYWVQHYPRIEKTCAQQAQVLGQRFSSLTKITDYQSVCTGETQTSYFIRIDYNAAEPLEVVSTLPEDGSSIYSLGTYPTVSACAADLKAETAHFAEATGLTPMVSYCYSGPYLSSTQNVALRTEAFGKPKLRPFLLQHQFHTSSPGNNLPGIQATIQAKLEAAGYDIRQTFFRRDITDFLSLGIRYYAANSMPLIYWEKFTFGSPNECNAQLKQIGDALGAFNESPIFMSCPPKNRGNVFLLAMYSSEYDVFQHEMEYVNFAACDADRARVIADYKAKMGWDVRAAVCEGYAPKIAMHLFKGPTEY